MIRFLCRVTIRISQNIVLIIQLQPNMVSVILLTPTTFVVKYFILGQFYLFWWFLYLVPNWKVPKIFSQVSLLLVLS